MSTKEEVIRDNMTSVVSIEVGMAHNSEVEVFGVGTLHASPISIRVSLLGPYMMHS